MKISLMSMIYKTQYGDTVTPSRHDEASSRHWRCEQGGQQSPWIGEERMSGPIRQLIGPTKTQLKRYLEEASTLLASMVDEKTLEDDKLRLEEVIARITSSVSLLERCNRDWTNVLKDLKGDDKAKEEKEYHRLANGS